jgi:3-phenylpropionate/trans-cinnamate dioxygenase ferredoxin subunit
MRVAIGDVGTLPRDQGIRVRVGEERIAMFRVGEEIFALDDRCSHAEAWLSEGEVFDTTVECPRHGSEFDLRTGKPLSLPATKPVRVYQVSVEDGTVYLELPEGER